MAKVEHVVANGARIPSLGFGTYGMRRSEMLRIIPVAIQAGFRHFDTAQPAPAAASLIHRSSRPSGIDGVSFCAARGRTVS